MVKHTQTIRRQQPMNSLSVFDDFVGMALKGLTITFTKPFQTNFWPFSDVLEGV